MSGAHDDEARSRDDDIDPEELDERLDLDMGEPRHQGADGDAAEGGTADDLGRGGD